jgi:hypothetical protein
MTRIAILGLCLISVSVGMADRPRVITFDDLLGQGPVPQGYAGLDWGSNWYYYDWSQDPYTPHSPETRIFSLLPDTAIRFGGPVDFVGAWFAGYTNVWIEGYLGGTLVAQSQPLQTTDVPTFLTMPARIDLLTVRAYEENCYVLDDLTWVSVPEAALVFPAVALVLGIIGLGCRTKEESE